MQVSALGGLAIAAGAVVAILRKGEIRLILLGSGLAMATLAGRPLAFADTFARSMVAPMIAPICAAIGFASVLKATGCDRVLTGLLTRPLRRGGPLVLPIAMGAAYLTNLAVPSQSGTAAMLGPILIPCLVSAGVAPVVAGAALVLGASLGGDLLSPAAQDLQGLAGTAGLSPSALSARIVPASLASLGVAMVVFSLQHRGRGLAAPPADTPRLDDVARPAGISAIKGAIPFLPVLLLLLAHAGWPPLGWLLRVDDSDARSDLSAAIPVVRSILIGVLAAALSAPKRWGGLGPALFEGMGSAYRDVISLTIAARCFGAGLGACGLGDAILRALGGSGRSVAALAIGFPWALATLSGSGSGPVLAFGQACLTPFSGRPEGTTLGALTCLSAAFGRTISPFSAVVICVSGLSGVSPLRLVRALALPLVAGGVAAFALVLARA